MRPPPKLCAFLLLGALFIVSASPAKAAESWAVDPKCRCQIGWISAAGSILVAASWSGRAMDGKAQGKGVLAFKVRDKAGKERQGRADAEMAAGKFDGKVSLKWSDGEMFDGFYKNGIREGRGVSKFPSGAVFTHEWRNGVADGHASLKYANGNSFDGEMKNNQLWKGLYKWSDGSTYEGEFTNGVITGKGLRKWTNGQSYLGDFKNGVADGKGAKLYINGATYEGDFIDGRPAGNGVLKDPQGAVIFVGERKNLEDESLQSFGEAAERLPAIPPSAQAVSLPATPATTLQPGTLVPAPRAERPTQEANLGSDRTSLRELRERLYELNFDPATGDAPFGEADRRAIADFEEKNNLPRTGEATIALLNALRSAGNRSPWGTIVFAKNSGKWGMAWGHASRKDAVDSALSSCGDVRQCTVELSFFGTECGAFAYSGSTWALAARANAESAQQAALADCAKGGLRCRIIASVCASGAIHH